jgi:hypothetical protein
VSALSFAAPGVSSAGEVVVAAATVRVPALPPSLDPAPAPPSAQPPAPHLALLLQWCEVARREHAALVAEAETLRVEMRAAPATPELTTLQATLDRRLLELSRLRARLEASLDHLVAETR